MPRWKRYALRAFAAVAGTLIVGVGVGLFSTTLLVLGCLGAWIGASL